MPKDLNNPIYWKELMAELMQLILPVPLINPHKEDRLADSVARCNPKTCSRSYDAVKLEEWIRGMKNIFTIIEVPEEKRVNIMTFYLTGKAYIWWSTVKDRLVGPEFTWSKFLEDLRAKCYSAVIQ